MVVVCYIPVESLSRSIFSRLIPLGLLQDGGFQWELYRAGFAIAFAVEISIALLVQSLDLLQLVGLLQQSSIIKSSSTHQHMCKNERIVKPKIICALR